MRAKDGVIVASQAFVYALISRVLRYYFHPDRKISASIGELRKGSLIVANHQSELDPFIILANLPLRTFLHVIPIRFPMSHEYFIRLKPLALLGAYDIGENKRERMLGLFKTRQYLTDRKSIMIFPEGHICDEETTQEFQRGLTFLTDVSRNVIFIRMKGFHRNKWLKLVHAERSMVFSEVRYLGAGRRCDVQKLRQDMDQLG